MAYDPNFITIEQGRYRELLRKEKWLKRLMEAGIDIDLEEDPEYLDAEYDKIGV